MERHELERQLRDTLVAKADTIHPSPALWEQVAGATTRRSRWARPATWFTVAGVAALLIAALVIVPNLLRGPATPEIVNTPEPAPAVTDVAPASAAVVWNEGSNEVGGGEVRQIDPLTGENLGVVFTGEDSVDAPFFQSLALRPGTGEIAGLVDTERLLGIQVRAPDGTLVASVPIGQTVVSGPVWSEDGAYLLWSTANTELHLLDWDPFVASDRADDPPGAAELGQIFSPNGWMNDTDLIAVRGSRGGPLTVEALPTHVALAPIQCDRDTCSYGLVETENLDDTQVLIAGTALLETAIAVDAPGSPTYRLRQVAELSPPFMELTVVVDGGEEVGLDLPDFAVDPVRANAFLAAAGSTVMVGYDGRAWLLQLSFGDTPTVTGVAEVEGGATVGALAPPVEVPVEFSVADAGTAPLADRLVVARSGENAIGGFGAVLDLDPATGEVQDTLFQGQPERDTPFTVSMDLQPGTGRLAQVVGIEGVWEVRVGLPGDPDYVQFAAGEDRASEDGNDRRPSVRWTQDGQTLLWTAEAADGSDDTWLYSIDLDIEMATPGELPLGDRVLALQPTGWGVPDVRLLDVVGTRGSELSVRAAVDGGPVDALLLPREGCAPDSDDACVYEVVEAGVGSRGTLLVAAADAGLNPGLLVGPGYQLTVEGDGPLALSYAGDGDLFGELALPQDLQEMDGDPLDTWMDAAGSTVVVGRGGRAWILTVTIDSDDPQVVRTIEIPGGVSTAAVVLDDGGGGSATAASGEVRVEIETTTTSPSGRPVTLDTATIVGGDLDPAVRDAVNADLSELSAQVLTDWDTRAEQDDRPELPAWELELEAEVTRVGPTLVSIAFAGFEFYGGANGSPYWLTRTYDLSTGDLLGYDDLFVAGSEQDVAAVVAEELATQQEFADAAALADAMREQDGSLDRVTITGDGFRFHFDEFSLGLPGAAGAPTASVLVPDVVSVVQPEIVDRYFTDGSVREPTTIDDVDPDPSAFAPRVTVAFDQVADRFTVAGPDLDTTTFGRPDGLVAEEVLVRAMIRPGGTNDRIEILTAWFVGDSARRAVTIVEDGEVVRNETAPQALQPTGGALGTAPDATARFDPAGQFLAWVELDADGDYRVVLEDWRLGLDNSTLARRTTEPIVTVTGITAFGIVEVSRDTDLLVVTTSAWLPGQAAQRVAGMFRVEVPLADSGLPRTEQATSIFVDTDGPVLDGGATGLGTPAASVGLAGRDDDRVAMYRLVDPAAFLVLDGLEAAVVIGTVPDGLAFSTGPGLLTLVALDDRRQVVEVPDGLVAYLL